MKIAVIGTGYVGLVVGVCLADLGNEVFCIDVDESKIESLKKGVLPIYEPGLKDILDINVKENRLFFTTDLRMGIKMSEVIFIAVGTPPGANHEADVTAVFNVAKVIGECMNGYKIIVNKSTVPVGTGEMVKDVIAKNMKGDYEFDVVSNPEFLREGTAVKDFTSPDRIIIGAETERAKKIMQRIYRGIVRTGKPLMITDIKSAEMIKYASNSFLATKISFINEIARLCEKVGADVKEVAKGMGLDQRIGPRFLQAGIGFGGSCFPKDVRALIQKGKENNIEFKIINAVETVNYEQRFIPVKKLKEIFGSLNNLRIGIWGLSFKPKTDDMREAPSITIINELKKEGADVIAFDPIAKENAKKILKDIEYGNTPYETAKNCNALLLLTEWNEFRELDMIKVKDLMKNPVLIDCRNIYEKEELIKMGFTYRGIGR
ncbi:UDP-glucose 6-dehydrogenase [candidate division KSB1 bacterium]|nr:MAG: UDP-glucose 6-dehydrogenase [candidate division KSB1 bacterium]